MNPNTTPISAENANAPRITAGLRTNGKLSARAAACREYYRFDQELCEHLALERTDREPDADLARSFGDRHEHDVHDPDAADEQAHGRDRGEEQREHSRHVGEHARDLGEVHHT